MRTALLLMLAACHAPLGDAEVASGPALDMADVDDLMAMPDLRAERAAIGEPRGSLPQPELDPIDDDPSDPNADDGEPAEEPGDELPPDMSDACLAAHQGVGMAHIRAHAMTEAAALAASELRDPKAADAVLMSSESAAAIGDLLGVLADPTRDQVTTLDLERAAREAVQDAEEMHRGLVETHDHPASARAYDLAVSTLDRLLLAEAATAQCAALSGDE